MQKNNCNAAATKGCPTNFESKLICRTALWLAEEGFVRRAGSFDRSPWRRHTKHQKAFGGASTEFGVEGAENLKNSPHDT